MERKYLLRAAYVGITLFATNAIAADKYWTCGDGSWGDDSCWNPVGHPLDGDSVYLTQSDNINRTVTYSNTDSPVSIRKIDVDATGSGTMTFSQSQDFLDVNSISVGFNGVGIYNQSGGSFASGDEQPLTLSLGGGVTGNGTYNLTGGYVYSYVSLIGSSGVTGGSGVGTFNQSGSSIFELGAGLYINSNSTYNLYGGTLDRSFADLSVGGTFNQSGGESINSNYVYGLSVNGVYNLSGGTAESARISVRGVFNQTNGAVSLYLDPNIPPSAFDGYLNIYGLYNLSGGTLDVDEGVYVNVKSGGSFNQTGGVSRLSDTMTIAADEGSSAAYNLSGGRLEATNIIVESGGNFNFDGGTLLVDNFTGHLVNNGGSLEPGDSPGVTNIFGDYTQTTLGTYVVELAGLTPGDEYDVLNISGTATLGGILDVNLLDSGLFTPTLGDSFDILFADTITGEFDLLQLAILGEGLDWDVSYLLDDIGTDILRLSVVNAVPVPAAVWLFGSGLIGLIGLARRKA